MKMRRTMVLMRGVRAKAPSLAVQLRALRQDLLRVLFDPYRPELHYMRGPGPKWHAKHSPSATPQGPIPLLALIRLSTSAKRSG
jgi:hypothetical protein